ncbi:MAG TPA: hypothetical protein VF772_12020 [Terriglobales bacterium]
MAQFPLQSLLTFPGWIRCACECQPAIKFLLDQNWVSQQSDHLGPDDLIEQFLSNETLIVANWAA